MKANRYRKVITVRLAQPVIAMLNKLAKREGVTRTALMERALRREIDYALDNAAREKLQAKRDAMLAAKTASAK